MKTVEWKSHTEIPTVLPITAVIAIREKDGTFALLSDIHHMTPRTNGQWVSEMDYQPIKHAQYWWLSEDSLLATLPPEAR